MTRQNPADLIRGGKLPEKPFPVCVDPDLVAEYEQLVAKRDTAKQVASTSLAGKATGELDAQIADLQQRMEAATIVLRLRALSRRRWRELRDEHPARKAEDGSVLPEDMFLGVNREPFLNALVRESIVEPELDAETVDLLLDERLTDGQWDELNSTCWNLNESRISVPLSSAASPSRKTSARK